MANKRDEKRNERWKGEEVERKPGDEAEEGADRAEVNTRVRADAEAERLRSPEPEAGPEPRRAPSGEDPEDETRDAAEEHREHRESDGYPPRGKL
jgi:hypothetical protein